MMNGKGQPAVVDDDENDAAVRAEVARLRRVCDAIERLLDGHHQALAERRRRERAS